MRQILRIITALITALVLICACALAEVPSPSDDFYVLDNAGVLDRETEAMIVFNNDELFAACGAQIAVVTLATTGGIDIERYARDLFEKWGIGDAEKHNGVLLLLAIDDDDYWVMQDRGLSRVLTSGELQLMLDDYLEPDFAAKRYDAGVCAFFKVLFERVAEISGANVTFRTGSECLAAWEGTSAGGNTDGDEEREASGKKRTGGGAGYEGDEEKEGSTSLKTIIGFLILIWIISRIFKGAGRRRGSSYGGYYMGHGHHHYSGGFGGHSGHSSGGFGGHSGHSSGGFGGHSGHSSGGFGGGRSGGGSHGVRGGGAGRGR